MNNKHLPLQALGATGAVLPFLGFGVSGSLASPLVSDLHVSNLVVKARQLGISVFDTAPFYGNGLAETRLAAGIRAGAIDPTLPRPFIITKGGTNRLNKKVWKDFSIDGLRKQLASSSERLSNIDAFFLHGPSEQDLTPALFRGLDKLKAEGWFRFVGVAGRGAELNKAISSGSFDLIMAPIHRDLPAEDLERIEQARTRNLGVIGIEVLSPAAKGVRFSLRPSDLWYTARAIAHRKAFQKIRHSPDACLQWVKKSGLADTILSTTTRAEHLISNVASCTL